MNYWPCLLFTFTIFLSKFCTQTIECPCDFVRLKNHCYYFGTVKVDWHRAKTHCEELFARLAYPIDSNENDELKSHLNTTYKKKNMEDWWLGGSDESNEGNWMWIAIGSNITYQDWWVGEPNDACLAKRDKPNNVDSRYCKEENCLSYRESFNWQWNDNCCEIMLLGKLCEGIAFGQDVVNDIYRSDEQNGTVYEFMAILPGDFPPCYRRFQILRKSSFYLLHLVIQKCFNWTDEHLHRFENFSSFPLVTDWVGYPVVPLKNEPVTRNNRETMIDEFLVELGHKCDYYYLVQQIPYVINLEVVKITRALKNSGYPNCINGDGFHPNEMYFGNGEYYDIMKCIDYPSTRTELLWGRSENRQRFNRLAITFECCLVEGERWSKAIAVGGLVHRHKRQIKINILEDKGRIY
ncbi:hypothetical protein CHUAL_011935 [Chamberlinius hualienensis]